MEREVLGQRSPLFGRRTGQILLRPFNHLEAARFHEVQYQRLRGELQAAHDASSLPEAPSEATQAALNDLLVRVRLRGAGQPPVFSRRPVPVG